MYKWYEIVNYNDRHGEVRVEEKFEAKILSNVERNDAVHTCILEQMVKFCRK